MPTMLSVPKTRKQLLKYFWDNEIWVDICKEGPNYIIQYDTWMCQTYIRCITNLTFEEWADVARTKIAECEHTRAMDKHYGLWQRLQNDYERLKDEPR